MQSCTDSNFHMKMEGSQYHPSTAGLVACVSVSPQYCWVMACAEEIFDRGESRLKRAKAISSMRAKVFTGKCAAIWPHISGRGNCRV